MYDTKNRIRHIVLIKFIYQLFLLSLYFYVALKISNSKIDENVYIHHSRKSFEIAHVKTHRRKSFDLLKPDDILINQDNSYIKCSEILLYINFRSIWSYTNIFLGYLIDTLMNEGNKVVTMATELLFCLVTYFIMGIRFINIFFLCEYRTLP